MSLPLDKFQTATDKQRRIQTALIPFHEYNLLRLMAELDGTNVAQLALGAVLDLVRENEDRVEGMVIERAEANGQSIEEWLDERLG